eukprot:jgi/Orpsp1_1/1174708/evm.model.c7180000051066.1
MPQLLFKLTDDIINSIRNGQCQYEEQIPVSEIEKNKIKLKQNAKSKNKNDNVKIISQSLSNKHLNQNNDLNIN